MKKLVTVISVVTVLGFLLTTGAFAQTAPGPGTTREPAVTRPATPGTPTMSSMNEVYASRLLGANVKNAQGENLGKIDELVIDPKDARIKAAILSIGGVLGLGAKSVAIPWEKVSMGTGTDEDTLVVAMAREELEKAPGWQKSN